MRESKAKAFIFTCFGILAICSTAQSEIIRLYPDGNGDYPTIQDAINASNEGDVIRLFDGTFSGPGNGDIDLTHTITIESISLDPLVCIVDAVGAQHGFIIDSTYHADYRFRGISITNAGYNGIYSMGLVPLRSIGSIVVDNCIISTCGGSGIGNGGPYDLYLNNTSIRHNGTGVGMGSYCSGAYLMQMTNCTLSYNGWGIRSGSGNRYLIYNSFITNSIQWGIWIDDLDECHGSDIGFEMYNSSVNNNGNGGLFLRLAWVPQYDPTCQITHSRIVDNAYTGIYLVTARECTSTDRPKLTFTTIEGNASQGGHEGYSHYNANTILDCCETDLANWYIGGEVFVVDWSCPVSQSDSSWGDVKKAYR